jgi:hypothetical protein
MRLTYRQQNICVVSLIQPTNLRDLPGVVVICEMSINQDWKARLILKRVNVYAIEFVDALNLSEECDISVLHAHHLQRRQTMLHSCSPWRKSTLYLYWGL